MLAQHFRIDHIHRLAGCEPEDVVDRGAIPEFVCTLHDAAEVRRANHVGHIEQRAFLYQRGTAGIDD